MLHKRSRYQVSVPLVSKAIPVVQLSGGNIERSKKDSEKAIQEIMALKQLVEAYRSEEVHLQAELLVMDGTTSVIETQEKLTAAHKIRVETEARVKLLRDRLGVDGRLNLTRLINDKYLQRRMNARTLKMRILQRLRERKFELERLQHSYRNVLNGKFTNFLRAISHHAIPVIDKKLSNHIRSATKRRDPTIQKLVKTYNSLVAEVQTMIQTGAAPRGARAPRLIDRDKLFSLDVDEAIWDDDDHDESETALWQCNEEVRRGIRLMLQYDRCIEEERQLRRERTAMQEWFVEEWQSTQKALDTVGEYFNSEI